MSLKIISAGAGSGKTYCLTQEMVSLLSSGKIRAGGIIATTFTNKAAAELLERVRITMLEMGMAQEANDLSNALIGTVHGLGVKLLKRFAFEAGVSPQVDILPEEDQQIMFNQSLAMALTHERAEKMEQLATRLGFYDASYAKTDWRRMLNDLIAVARANDFSAGTFETSRQRSFTAFCNFLGEEDERPEEEWNALLAKHIETSLSSLENNGDTTKTTADAVKVLKELERQLQNRQELPWSQWAKISKIKVAVKSRDDLAPLAEFANTHLRHSSFRGDIKSFIYNTFDLAQAAIAEYDQYKKSRGLIDYTDMEVLVNRLLDHPVVREALSQELNLLMVDEFQDTSPLQLNIFLKLSQFADYSVWVGDPKQSIYGFRGAEPALMKAIIESQGGLKKENILKHSWRSREPIVSLTNAIFTAAFKTMAPEQVVLQAKRRSKAGFDTANRDDEPEAIGNALHHWHFKPDEDGRTNQVWFNHCLAEALHTVLERGMLILPKGERKYRNARPGDVAILCRSNYDCQSVAEALHQVGLRAAISRAGLLSTAEARLILACLKFILNKYDSLSIAELLLLAGEQQVEDIMEDRLNYLEERDAGTSHSKWGEQNPFIQRLNQLRALTADLSGSEILALLLSEMDLRRIIASWGNPEQRLGNVDALTNLAFKYEEACNRLQSAASLGGFLLWLNELENVGADFQSSGENAGAVNVLTYHKSKGLEYPVTICHSLENKLRDDVWGLSVVAETEQVDLNNLLGNRWLRLWVNPYGSQFQKTLLAERIDASPEKADKRREALEEEARLLYVGITRARDYLVFPTRKEPPLWLNRVCGEGNENFPALTEQSQSNWEWGGKALEIDLAVGYFPKDFGHADFREESVLYLTKPEGKKSHPPFLFNLAGNQWGAPLQIGSEGNYASAIPLPEVQERVAVAKAIHLFMLADRRDMEEQKRLKMAEDLLERYGALEFCEPALFASQSLSFQNWLGANFSIQKIRRLYPLSAIIDGSLFQTRLDFLIETESGWIAILNLPFVGDLRNRRRKLKEMGGTVSATTAALREVFGIADIRFFAHFVLYGALVEMEE